VWREAAHGGMKLYGVWLCPESFEIIIESSYNPQDDRMLSGFHYCVIATCVPILVLIAGSSSRRHLRRTRGQS